MRKIILDTNAFRYFYQTISDDDMSINKIMNKKLDKDKYLDSVLKSDYVLLTSESLFELFLQSYWNTGSIKQFCIIYQSILNRIGKERLRIFNSYKLYFDIEELSKSVKENKIVKIDDYISPRAYYEYILMTELCWLIICSFSDMLFELFGDISNPSINESNQNFIQGQIKEKVKDLYDQYYMRNNTNEQFKSQLDELLENLLRCRLSIVLCMIKQYKTDIIIPDEIFEIRNTKGGADYCKNVICFLSQINGSVRAIFNSEVKRNIQLRKNNLMEVSLSYMGNICKNFIAGRKIQKNDIIDCSILTIFDPKSIPENQTGKEFDFQDIRLITFDKFVYRFSEENRCGFNKDFYDYFLI